MCDKDFKFTFTTSICYTIEPNDKKDVLFKGFRVYNIYMLKLDDVSLSRTKCLATLSKESWLLHKRLAHVSFDMINKVVTKDLVTSLPWINFSKDHLCLHVKKGSKQGSLLNITTLFNFETPWTSSHRFIWSIKD